jgi:hypothetical protein
LDFAGGDGSSASSPAMAGFALAAVVCRQRAWIPLAARCLVVEAIFAHGHDARPVGRFVQTSDERIPRSIGHYEHGGQLGSLLLRLRFPTCLVDGNAYGVLQAAALNVAIVCGCSFDQSNHWSQNESERLRDEQLLAPTPHARVLVAPDR